MDTKNGAGHDSTFMSRAMYVINGEQKLGYFVDAYSQFADTERGNDYRLVVSEVLASPCPRVTLAMAFLRFEYHLTPGYAKDTHGQHGQYRRCMAHPIFKLIATNPDLFPIEGWGAAEYSELFGIWAESVKALDG